MWRSGGGGKPGEYIKATNAIKSGRIVWKSSLTNTTLFRKKACKYLIINLYSFSDQKSLEDYILWGVLGVESQGRCKSHKVIKSGK